MLMKAMVFSGPGRMAPGDIPEPGIREPTDAIIRVTIAAICSSDLHIKEGLVPRAVPGIAVGHEFVGIVERIGQSVKNIKAGDRVAVNCETFCGNCFYCRNGWVNNCTDANGGWALGCRIDGGQAEYARIPYADNCLIKIPDNVTDESALLTGDLLSTGYWATDIGNVSQGDVVAIIGAGPTGLCCAMLSRLKGPAKIIILDVDQQRLEFAMSNGFADIALNPNEIDVESTIKGMTDDRGADVVMEVAGGKDTFDMAWRIARPNAIVVIVAMYGEGQTIPLPDMYGKNLTFKTGGVDGSHCKEIMELISSGKIDATPLITHRFPFSHIEEAYELFSERKDGVIKVAIYINV